ncbi:zinc finger protein 865-like isoform X1 [Portunus trituberculatus]|uniref:zinc finger protein 865-like isoform X1 n=1 Tax=Portunus trituberculatus TaxID=210409 RepID=UPI001E1D0E46|nr:zinc finger protein 865-like isoform X1 [Portunus trituberculatus]XP_045132205.1 zinc finger protein 865-like isoform X1 [Portunus trituberculatus]XP_045132212.1 zinc finger protein 865-like isoform X1 [Portunus trituberculatus]
MSNSISTFIMRGSDVEGEEHGTETTTNTQSYQTFLPPPTPAAAPTFITGATDSFLALPEQMEGEGEGLLGSGEGDGVSQGSLLYLDSASALHVLVHHLPQPSHQPTPPQLVEEEGSEEQFVVVGALKNEDELATSASPTTCHVSVESILEEELAGGRGEIYLPQPQEPTPAPQHLPQAPVLALVDGSGSGDTGDTTGITLDTVPHITLEEIIQKFASSPGSPIDDLDDSTTTTITAITPPPDPAPLPPPPPTVSPRVKVKLLPEKRKGECEVEELAEGDDGCLYDVVVTYRCRVCGDVYDDKAALLYHHQQSHKQKTQGGIIKIRVTSSDTRPTTITTTPAGGTEHPNKRMKEGTGEGTGMTRRHYQPQGSQVTYPAQPGLLIGHRKARIPDQGEADTGGGGGGGGGEGVVEGKRKVKAPRTLQDQFWLQKQRPKPVCLVEVDKTYRCPISTCKYKFSSKAKLQTHQGCHGGGPGKGEERGFTCPHCALRFDKWSVCQLHLWKEHGVDIDLLTCGICHTYKTCTQQRLLVHQKIHSDARDHVCKTCGKGFKQLAQLLNHQVQHITSPKDFPAWAEKSYCEECQHWFRDRKSLRMHISLVHLKRKPHSCPHCPYRCSRSFDLKVHMRQHTGERPHRCPLCGWQTRDHNSMRRHKLGHQERKPFRCPLPLCQFETRHPAYFKRHMARRHLDNEALYACLFCPLTTPSLQDYIKHSMKHEKDLAEEAMKRAMQADTDTPGDATTAPREEPTPVTTAIALTTEDATKKTSPIDFNHKVGFIAIKFDDAAASEGKGETVDEVVVEEVEGESVSGVSLPQVVVSGSNGHYLLDIPGIGEDGEARVISSAPPQHHIITTTTATSHYTTPQLPHNTSLQDCSTTT